MSKSPTTTGLRPGTPTPRSGIYNQAGLRGGATTSQADSTRGNPLPPAPKGNTWNLTTQPITRAESSLNRYGRQHPAAARILTPFESSTMTVDRKTMPISPSRVQMAGDSMSTFNLQSLGKSLSSANLQSLGGHLTATAGTPAAPTAPPAAAVSQVAAKPSK